MDRHVLVNRNTASTRPNNTVNGSTPQSSSETNYLNLSLEELMQIPVTSVSSFWNNNDNYLDLSIEELMTIPVSGSLSDQQHRI